MIHKFHRIYSKGAQTIQTASRFHGGNAFAKKMISIHRVKRAAISQSAKKKKRKTTKKEEERKNWWSRVLFGEGLHGGPRSRARRPGVPIPACHNRGMSSPLGWPAHGCATELFIPLDYTRCAVPRRAAPSGRRKRPRELARTLRVGRAIAHASLYRASMRGIRHTLLSFAISSGR